jgi:hypothetical protein
VEYWQKPYGKADCGTSSPRALLIDPELFLIGMDVVRLALPPLLCTSRFLPEDSASRCNKLSSEDPADGERQIIGPLV